MGRLVIKKEDLAYNVGEIRRICGNTVIGVVKGNGYGLSLVPFAKALLENGIDFLAVSKLSEAEELRCAGIDCDILLLSPTSLEADAEKIIELSLIASIGSADSATALSVAAEKAGKTARAHLKINSGFGRYGFLTTDIDKIYLAVTALKNIEFTGVFSHLSCASGRKKQALAQYNAFTAVCEALKAKGVDIPFRHIANSAAALRFPEIRLSACRIGSAFLGRVQAKSKLKKIGSFEAPIDEINYLPKGHNVGYANVYKTKALIKTAVVGFGTSDGLFCTRSRDAFRFVDRLRYLLNDFKFFFKKAGVKFKLNGKKGTVIGRIGLTNFVIDITGIDAEAGDIAVFDVNPIFLDSAVPREYI